MLFNSNLPDKIHKTGDTYPMAYGWIVIGIQWTNGKWCMPTFPHICLLGYSILNSLTWLSVNSTVYSGADKKKKTSKLRVTSLRAGNSPGPVNSPHKWPVTRKMFPFDDVIMHTITPAPGAKRNKNPLRTDDAIISKQSKTHSRAHLMGCTVLRGCAYMVCEMSWLFIVGKWRAIC